jgi:hypothetical protein
VRDLASGLETAMGDALIESKRFVSDLLHKRDASDTRETTDKDFDEASELLVSRIVDSLLFSGRHLVL